MVAESANPGIRDALAGEIACICESRHFTVFSYNDSVVVLHLLKPGEIDNDLAESVAGELVRPGHVGIANAFERCFAGVVLSSGPNPTVAWRAFYDNTLMRLEQAASGSQAEDDFGPITVFERIYEHARSLIAGSSLLDIGTCFGFFPLLLQRAEPQLDTTALDVSKPIIELARDASQRREGSTKFVSGNACNLPFETNAFDTVTALHVLEHLTPSSASRALCEMCRVARQRVIVTVPTEEEPDPAYEHVQGFDREGLIKLAEETGWRCDFEEYLGGWIVLEPRDQHRVEANALQLKACS